MTLIEKFENMPVQDVGTFNSIFKTTPILGFNSNLEVEIGDVTKDDQRKILVGTEVILMNLTQKKSVKEKKKTVTFVRPMGTLEKVKKVTKTISNLYKLLTPTEFMIYSAIKEAEEIHGIEELSRQIFVSNKTIIANLPRLISLGLVKKQYVACEGKAGSFNKLTVDASVEIN